MSPAGAASTPRYDGLAAWYDDFVRSTPFTQLALESLERLLGPGPGRCLDLGCGTGVAFEVLTQLGWEAVGIDLSLDQLALARLHAERAGVQLVHGDAARLPFPDASFEAAVSLLTHTDLEEPEAALREAARVVRPGGRLVHVGMHPCFAAPTVERRDAQPHLLHPGYRDRRFWHDAPGFRFGQAGLRGRVGIHHQPLADVLNGIVAAGFRLDRFEEPPGDDYPLLLSLVASLPRDESSSSESMPGGAG